MDDDVYLISAIGPLHIEGHGITMSKETRELLEDNGWTPPENENEKSQGDRADADGHRPGQRSIPGPRHRTRHPGELEEA
jgi:hypothetical protein